MLRVDIYKIANPEDKGVKVGFYIIPDGVDLEWCKRNAPYLLYGSIIIAEEVKIGNGK